MRALSRSLPPSSPLARRLVQGDRPGGGDVERSDPPQHGNPGLEIAAELRKVSWPNLPETRAATIAVIVASLIAAVLLGLFDVFWQFLTDKIQNPTL